MEKLSRAPWLGAAYYPEDWPEEEIGSDIKRMKEIGITAVRIGEFAWHRMEPRPGEFDFSFFHRVVDRLGEAGIAVVMGTPTATPPRWLSRLYPDVLCERENGRAVQHGGRRHCCSNNPHYNEYCMRIVERMAQEFADDSAVAGWQIDNEIYIRDRGVGCFCPNCRAAFREKLRKKYGSVDALNDAWNLNIFSQWYDDFADIPVPRDTWHNPHLIQAWYEFQADSHIEFVHRQAEILHRYVKVPVGTDVMPVNGMDHRRLTGKLDVVQFNHYNTPANLYTCAFWFDFLRTLKDRPFWNTETDVCWNGSTAISQSLKPEGFCRANSWLPIALGGEANMYWLWRTHWGGHELTHGAVLDTSGRCTHTVGEVKEVARGYARAAEFIGGGGGRTNTAIHFTSLSWNMNMAQPVVKDLKYAPTVQAHWYKPAVDLGLRPDVIDAAQPLDGYRLLITPMVMSLEEHGLPERITEWVKEGGTWLVGPLTDVRNAEGARYKNRFYGMLEDLTGVRWCYGVPDTEGHLEAEWQDGTAFRGSAWFELCEDCGSDTLVRVTEGHSALRGKSLAVKRSIGKGTVILLGTIPSEADAARLIRLACEASGAEPVRIEGEVMAARRSGTAGEGLMLVEYGGKDAACTLPEPMVDLLTGRRLQNRAALKPYDVLVLKATE